MSNRNERLLIEDAVNFCYCDESGTGQEPIATMIGIIVDSGRMHKTKADWEELLAMLSTAIERNVSELHTAHFYAGKGIWRNMTGEQRSRVITAILEWLSIRKHHVVYSSVVKESYFKALGANELPEELSSPWRFLGFHLILAIQRYSQPEDMPKGNTFLVFDNQERQRVRFNDIVKNPPAWSDEYYGRKKKQGRLDQIIDVPAFQDSKDVGLLQVADFLAFFLRRYAEIKERLVSPKYEDEAEKVTSWCSQLQERCISTAHIYPKRGRTVAHEYFYRHAPVTIRDM